jgi:methylated-DNA-[protein]-cysteine S-methyltransferase
VNEDPNTDRLYRTTLGSPVGTLTLVASERGLRAVLWPGDRPGRVRLGPAADAAAHPVLAEAAAQLAAYFAGRRDRFELALDPRGTPFQLEVWARLADVGPGTTISYGELASRVGRPRAQRAVGAAVGRNPLSIVVPCHRVVGRDGSLTGFAGGTAAKRWLLDHEARRAAGPVRSHGGTSSSDALGHEARRAPAGP